VLVKFIHGFLHFFHRPFSKVMTQQQFRYIACGGFMAVLDICMFSFVDYVLLRKHAVHLGPFTIPSEVAAIWFPFPFGFALSYLLSRYVVFHDTGLKNTTSFIRYSLLVASCFILNTLLIKFLVEVCVLNAILSKVICIVTIAGYSYMVQRFFAFKKTMPIIE